MPDDIKTVSSYDRDFFAWGLAQAKALRAAHEALQQREPGNSKLQQTLQALDWDNLAEEIEGLARRDRRELTSRVLTVIEHLVKLQFSTAHDPRAGWTETIGRARSEIEDILHDSPSLRRELADVVARKSDSAVALATKSLVQYGELTEAAALRLNATYSVDQVVGDWWPEAPKAKRVSRHQDKP